MLLNCFVGLLLTCDAVCCGAKCSYWMSTLNFRSFLPSLEFLGLARAGRSLQGLLLGWALACPQLPLEGGGGRGRCPLCRSGVRTRSDSREQICTSVARGVTFHQSRGEEGHGSGL